MPSIDLHTHSTKSDGTLTPAQLVEMARELGLSALALTDHDSVDGIAEAEEAAERFFMESPAEDPAGCSPEPASGYGTAASTSWACSRTGAIPASGNLCAAFPMPGRSAIAECASFCAGKA